MENKTKILIGAGILTTILYIILSMSISTDPMIWYLTRIFGLISIFSLFVTIVLGELRVLHLVKSDFELFRFHTPIAIFSVFIVLLHGISAVSDKYMWGKSLVITQFLGFSFGDKWLIYLSLGTLAFYLMLLIGMTSPRVSIQKIGYKNWKLIHFFSYAAFIIAYIHSTHLGTDIKTSALSPILSIIMPIMLVIIIAFFITRIIVSTEIYTAQRTVFATALLILILILGGLFIVRSIAKTDQKITELNTAVNEYQTQIEGQGQILDLLNSRTELLLNELLSKSKSNNNTAINTTR